MCGLKERFVCSLGVIDETNLCAVLKTSQPYKGNVERIIQDLSNCEPDVCLAVKLARSQSQPPSIGVEEDTDDDSEIDRFFSSHGFEYIDATEEQASPSVDEVGNKALFSDGKP